MLCRAHAMMISFARVGGPCREPCRRIARCAVLPLQTINFGTGKNIQPNVKPPQWLVNLRTCFVERGGDGARKGENGARRLRGTLSNSWCQGVAQGQVTHCIEVVQYEMGTLWSAALLVVK